MNERLKSVYSEIRPMPGADNLGDSCFHSAFLLQIQVAGKLQSLHQQPQSVETKSIRVVTPLPLLEKMPLFSKVFKDPHEKTTVTIQISASEEAAVMELLRFMDGNPISALTVGAILDVLVAADKFEFGSCVNHCTQLLKTFPMTLDSALSFLKLQSRVSMVEEVQPLADAASQYLASHYENNVGFKDKLMALPLLGVEAIVSSDDLRVEQEDDILEFVLKWSRAKYPKLEERREILTRRLLRCIRFPHLSLKRLKEVLSCNDFDRETAAELVMKALFVKLEPPRQQKGERQYKLRPLKMVEFEVPRPQCLVYLDLKREECATLFPCGAIFSETFMFAGEECFLSAYCIESSDHHLFGVVLWRRGESFTVDSELAARSKPSDEFTPMRIEETSDRKFNSREGKSYWLRNLFEISWNALMGEDSVYFINGILHLRIGLILRQ